MWELDYKENWVLKNWCFWTVVLEKTLESPLGCKEIKPAHPKGDQSRLFIGRTDTEAETPILWPPDEKSWLIRKDPDTGKDKRAGGEGDERGGDGWMESPIQWTWVWARSGNVKDREAWHAAVHGVAKSWTRLSHWTTRNIRYAAVIIIKGKVTFDLEGQLGNYQGKSLVNKWSKLISFYSMGASTLSSKKGHCCGHQAGLHCSARVFAWNALQASFLTASSSSFKTPLTCYHPKESAWAHK